MKTLKALLLIICTVGLLSWSNLEAQVPPASKKTITKSTTSPSQGSVKGNGNVAPVNSTKAATKKKPKGTTTTTTTFGDGSVHFKSIGDGTSNTPKNSTNVAAKKKKKGTKPKPTPKPSFGGISDGSSNTIMHGESSSGKKTLEPVKTKANHPTRVVK